MRAKYTLGSDFHAVAPGGFECAPSDWGDLLVKRVLLSNRRSTDEIDQSLKLPRACLLCIGVDGFATGKRFTKPATEMPPDVVLEWQHAGAKPGWMRTDTWGRLGFCTEREEPEPGDLPAFELYDCQKGRLEALPAPSVPFGLSLRGVAVEDTDLDELTRFGASRLLICAAP